MRTASLGFGSIDNLERLDWVSRRYHKAPSDYTALRGLRAFQLDEACALAGANAELRIQRQVEAEQGGNGQGRMIEGQPVVSGKMPYLGSDDP